MFYEVCFRRFEAYGDGMVALRTDAREPFRKVAMVVKVREYTDDYNLRNDEFLILCFFSYNHNAFLNRQFLILYSTSYRSVGLGNVLFRS